MAAGGMIPRFQEAADDVGIKWAKKNPASKYM